MDFSKVEKMMQLMRSYGMHEVEIKEGDTQIKLIQSPPVQPAAPYGQFPVHNTFAAPVAGPPVRGGASGWENSAGPHDGATAAKEPQRRANTTEIRSPFVGTYYSAPSPGSDDFVHVGKRVRKGDTLCIVEAMKLMNEIEAERDGVIVEVLVANEEPIEYDQVLFLIE